MGETISSPKPAETDRNCAADRDCKTFPESASLPVKIIKDYPDSTSDVVHVPFDQKCGMCDPSFPSAPVKCVKILSGSNTQPNVFKDLKQSFNSARTSTKRPHSDSSLPLGPVKHAKLIIGSNTQSNVSEDPKQFSESDSAQACSHSDSDLSSTSNKHDEISTVFNRQSQIFKVPKLSSDSDKSGTKVLPSASVIYSRILSKSKTPLHVFKIIKKSPDSVPAPTKGTTFKTITLSSSLSAAPTPGQVKVNSTSSESLPILGSNLVSGSTPGSFKVTSAISVPTSKKIGNSNIVSGSLDEAKLHPTSVSILDPVKEKAIFSQMVQDILLKVSSISQSSLQNAGDEKNKFNSLPAESVLKPKEEFQCPVCGLLFSTWNFMNKHMNRVHWDYRTDNLKQLSVVCPECPHLKKINSKT